MPELPEVETIKNDLKNKIIGKKIKSIDILLVRSVRNKAAEFKKSLINGKFKDIKRVGKLMIFTIDPGDKFLLIHLKMTGQLIYRLQNELIAGGHSLSKAQESVLDKFTRVIINFSDQSNLLFNDMRTFGYLEIVDSRGLEKALKKFGPDTLDSAIDAKMLDAILKKRSAPIKAVLLDQKILAGIGNIYADEILFQIGVRPDRPAQSLTATEIKKMAAAIKLIIKKAVRFRGTTFNNYVDSEGRKGNFSKLLKVYGRKGERCHRCGGLVQKQRTAGRGTHFCPRCQK